MQISLFGGKEISNKWMLSYALISGFLIFVISLFLPLALGSVLPLYLLDRLPAIWAERGFSAYFWQLFVPTFPLSVEAVILCKINAATLRQNRILKGAGFFVLSYLSYLGCWQAFSALFGQIGRF